MRVTPGTPTGTFVQSTPSNTWVINHNFGKLTITDVILSTGEKILPVSVQHSNQLNTTTILFTSPRTGEVRVVGLAIDLGTGSSFFEPTSNAPFMVPGFVAPDYTAP